MRNLKKILALVLALVMSLSLMATAGAADAAATSSETVTPAYEIALQVLGKDGLKVFGGYTDGTIRPQNNITRAEVAAILYRIVTGDVTDAQAGIYTDMANVNFNDLTGANWAKGYINYCANAQLIVGVGGNQFKPLANITGYATLAMILRALGYDKNGEFKGSGWEIRTASKARELGILKNVSENQLGSSATRELVAELLFRAMLCDKVTYNALTQDYDKTGVTLGYDVFSLEEVKGIVVANEYADIRRNEDGTGYTSVLAKDTTVLRDEKGNDRTVDRASGLEDLGEARVVYTIESGKRNGYTLQNVDMENPGTDAIIYDGYEKQSKIPGTARKDETEYYINFGEQYTEVKTAIKISYEASWISDYATGRTQDAAVSNFCTKYNLDKATVTANGALETIEATYTGSGRWHILYTPKSVNDVKTTSIIDRNDKAHIYSIVEKKGELLYRVEIQPNTLLNPADKDMIHAIFYTANLNPEKTDTLVVDGQVFRGTQSLYDYSDWKGYDDFADECLTARVESTNVSDNSLGYWLKVIDNDNDGIVDWVFQTRYTVASVATEKDGAITLDTESSFGCSSTPDSVNLPANYSSVSNEGDAVAVGDVVNYAAIDGVARVWKADAVEARVESINRTNSTVTTADGTTYNESAVHEHSVREDLDSGVINMAGKTAYMLYMDRSGENLAAFSQNIAGKFTLLTDGWYHTLKNGSEYAVQAWDKDEQKFVQYDITSGGNMFIDSRIDGNNWNRIARFEPVNCDIERNDAGVAIRELDNIHTIMAYMETDGENATLLPVDMVYDTQRIEGRRPVNMIDMGTAIPTEGRAYGQIWRTTSAGNYDGDRFWNDPNWAWSGVYAQPVNANGAVVNQVTEDSLTEVRALSSTVYYYVYRTWYNGAYTMAVRQFTGYRDGANWMNLNSSNSHFVEDVYVVGTKAWHTDATGDTTNPYYTADAVVIELNDDFYNAMNLDHEQVFVYDFSNVVGSVGQEKVSVIRANGETAELTIDLSRSERIYWQGNNKDSVPMPGLFYLWQTNTPDVWAISRMSHEDIQTSGSYDVGTVEYSRFTFGSDYANITNWYTFNSGYHFSNCGDTHEDTMIASPVMSDNRYDNANAKYYDLSYSDGTNGYVSSLNPSSAGVCLAETYKGLTNGGTNEVLVRYNTNENSTDYGKIIYAISFAHADGNDENLAMTIWRSTLMDYPRWDGSVRAIEIVDSGAEDLAQALALPAGVDLTDAVKSITVDGKAMREDTAKDKFYTIVERKGDWNTADSYEIVVTLEDAYASCTLTDADRIDGVTVTPAADKANTFTLTFAPRNDAPSAIRLQIPRDSVETPKSPEEIAKDEALAKAKEAIESPTDAEVEAANLTDEGVKAVEAAKDTLQAVIDNEAATAEELNKAVTAYNTAIEEAMKMVKPDDTHDPVNLTVKLSDESEPDWNDGYEAEKPLLLKDNNNDKFTYGGTLTLTADVDFVSVDTLNAADEFYTWTLTVTNGDTTVELKDGKYVIENITADTVIEFTYACEKKTIAPPEEENPPVMPDIPPMELRPARSQVMAEGETAKREAVFKYVPEGKTLRVVNAAPDGLVNLIEGYPHFELTQAEQDYLALYNVQEVEGYTIWAIGYEYTGRRAPAIQTSYDDPDPTPYTITIGEMTGGIVTADPTSATEGATVTLTVAPEGDNELKTLTYTVEGEAPVAIEKTAEGAYTFTMPAADVTINATFGPAGEVKTPITSVAITLDPTTIQANGTLPVPSVVTVPENAATVSATWDKATDPLEAGVYTATFTVTPADGFETTSATTYTVNGADAAAGALTATVTVTPVEDVTTYTLTVTYLDGTTAEFEGKANEDKTAYTFEVPMEAAQSGNMQLTSTDDLAVEETVPGYTVTYTVKEGDDGELAITATADSRSLRQIIMAKQNIARAYVTAERDRVLEEDADTLDGNKRDAISKAVTDANTAITASSTQAELVAAMSKFDTDLEAARNAGNLSEEDGELTLKFWVDPATAANAADVKLTVTADKVVELLTAEDPDHTYSDALITTATNATGETKAVVSVDGVIRAVTLQQVVKVWVNGDEEATVNYGTANGSTVSGITEGHYLPEASLTGNTAAHYNVASDGDLTLKAAANTDLRLVDAVTVTCATGTPKVYKVGHATANTAATAATVTTGDYVQVGATLLVTALTTSSAGVAWEMKCSLATEPVSSLPDKFGVTTEASGAIGDLSYTVANSNMTLTFAKGYVVIINGIEVGVVDPSSGLSTVSADLKIPAGNYIPVSTALDANVLVVAAKATNEATTQTVTDAGTFTGADADDYAENGVIEFVPATKVTFDAALETMTATINGETAYELVASGTASPTATQLKVGTAYYAAATATLTVTDNETSAVLEEGQKLVAVYTPAAAGADEVTDELTADYSLNVATTAAGITIGIASPAVIPEAGIDLGTVKTDASGANKFEGVAATFEDQFEDDKGAATVAVQSIYSSGDYSVPTASALESAMSTDFKAGAKISVQLKITPADSYYFNLTEAPEVPEVEGLDEDSLKVSYADGEITISFTVTLTAE